MTIEQFYTIIWDYNGGFIENTADKLLQKNKCKIFVVCYIYEVIVMFRCEIN